MRRTTAASSETQRTPSTSASANTGILNNGATFTASTDSPNGPELRWTLNRDTVLNGSLTGFDANGDALSYTIVQNANDGVVALVGNGPNFTFSSNDRRGLKP